MIKKLGQLNELAVRGKPPANTHDAGAVVPPASPTFYLRSASHPRTVPIEWRAASGSWEIPAYKAIVQNPGAVTALGPDGMFRSTRGDTFVTLSGNAHGPRYRAFAVPAKDGSVVSQGFLEGDGGLLIPIVRRGAKGLHWEIDGARRPGGADDLIAMETAPLLAVQNKKGERYLAPIAVQLGESARGSDDGIVWYEGKPYVRGDIGYYPVRAVGDQWIVSLVVDGREERFDFKIAEESKAGVLRRCKRGGVCGKGLADHDIRPPDSATGMRHWLGPESGVTVDVPVSGLRLPDIYGQPGRGEFAYAVVDGYGRSVSYNVELATWVIAETKEPIHRVAEDEWSVTPPRATPPFHADVVRTMTVPDIPPPPTSTSEIPNRVMQIWIGDAIPEHLAENVVANAEFAKRQWNAPLNLYVDVGDHAFSAMKSRFKETPVMVRNLRASKLLQRFRSEHPSLYAQYQTATTGRNANRAMGADILRLVGLHYKGGIYLDADDLFQARADSAEKLPRLRLAKDDLGLGKLVTVDFLGEGQVAANSPMASHKGNPVLVKMLNGMDDGLAEARGFFDDPRPRDSTGGNSLSAPMRDYIKKISDLTGPGFLTSWLKALKPGMWAFLEGYYTNAGTRTFGGNVGLKRAEATAYYTPFDQRIRVERGSEHSWKHSR